MNTLVLQSYRTKAVPRWLKTCHGTVKDWAADVGYDYRFVGDELFDYIPSWFKEKCKGQMLPITDLGRLQWMERLMREGAPRVVWVDYDVVILDRSFRVPQNLSVLFTKEKWIDRAPDGRLVQVEAINNSIMMIERGSPILEFLIGAILARARQCKAPVDRCFAGTRLLTELATVFEPPLLRRVAQISPTVLIDLARGSLSSLNMLAGPEHSSWVAANLCGAFKGRRCAGFQMTDILYESALHELRTATIDSSGIYGGQDRFRRDGAATMRACTQPPTGSSATERNDR
jgi:hypothetical protein